MKTIGRKNRNSTELNNTWKNLDLLTNVMRTIVKPYDDLQLVLPVLETPESKSIFNERRKDQTHKYLVDNEKRAQKKASQWDLCRVVVTII